MGRKRKEAPMKADAITLTPNGRLTEHTAYLDVRGNVPTLAYKNSSGRRIIFTPMRLILAFQWSWSVGGWHLLEVRALGRNGVQDITVTFRNPDVAPDWVKTAVKMATPTLAIPQEKTG